MAKEGRHLSGLSGISMNAKILQKSASLMLMQLGSAIPHKQVY